MQALKFTTYLGDFPELSEASGGDHVTPWLLLPIGAVIVPGDGGQVMVGLVVSPTPPPPLLRRQAIDTKMVFLFQLLHI